MKAVVLLIAAGVLTAIAAAGYVTLTIASTAAVATAIAAQTPTEIAANQIPPVGYGPVTDSQIVTASGFQVHVSIAGNVNRLVAAAAADGYRLSGWAYRSNESQRRLRRENCGPTAGYDPGDYTVSSSSCSPPTARPGRSNHETGRAIDFKCNGAPMVGSPSCFRWLQSNAAAYGFYNLPSERWHWSTNGK